MRRCGEWDIKLKIRSIKVSIIGNLFISLILAVFSTGVLFLMFFGSMEFISQKTYDDFLIQCYSTMTTTLVFSMVLMLIYLLNFIVIFVFRLNEITDTIKKISMNIHKLAQGNFQEKLSVKSNHELGVLANDINKMSDQIEEHIKDEQRWNEERYHMITNISHDLKTPIMSISGYMELIKSGKYKDEDERYNYCEIVSKKTEELSTAINQLFELSRLNSNTLHLKKVDVNLNEFIEQVMVSYIPLLEEQKMDFRIQIPVSIRFFIDPTFMKRVFENIILNAIKYASSGRLLDICAEELDNRITIHFTNYGPKISEEDIIHIFERYYRAKKNLANEGNGLGLAIAKTIVLLHGGEIDVISDEEKTDFYITIFKNTTESSIVDK